MTTPIVNSEDNKQIAQTIKTDRGRPKMFSVDWLFDVANKAALVCLALGLAAAVLVYATSVRKEQRSNEKTAELEKDTALANERIAQLNVELLKEQNERLKLLAVAKARDLTDEQFAKLVEAFKAIRSRVTGIVYVYVADDPEAKNFSGTIIYALGESGIGFNFGFVHRPDLPFQTGYLQVYEYTPPGTENSGGQLLVDALNSAGVTAALLETHVEMYAGMQSPSLFIGPKGILIDGLPSWARDIQKNGTK